MSAENLPTGVSTEPSPGQAGSGEGIQLAGFYPLDLVIKHLSEVRTTQPVAALAAANQYREALTSVFLNAVERALGDPTGDFAKHGMLFNYATYFLAKWRETRAYPLFLRWFALPGDDALELGGDTVSHQGARFLASVCGGDVVGLKQLTENRAANPLCRGQAILALAVATAWGEHSREDLEGYFTWLAREGLERQMDFTWTHLVLATLGMELKGVFPELRRVCQEGIIPDSFLSVDALNELEQRPAGEGIKAFRDQHPPIADVVSETRWWAGFQRETAAVAPAARAPRSPYQAPPKVGRNDPCPCGSGKKYKKCCGA